MSSPLTNARTLAIILPSWVGDTVMATPGLRAIRAALPEARIVGVMRPGIDEILRGSPWLDDLIVCNFRGLAGPWRAARAIHHSNADSVLLLPNSFRAALAARLSGTPDRIGYARDLRSALLTHKLAPPKQRPIPAVDYYAALVEFALGVPHIDRTLELRCTDEQLAAAEYMLRDVARPFVVLNPGANRADKRWPAERFARLAEELSVNNHVSVLVTGSPTESDVLAAVTSVSRIPLINLAQRGITLGTLKAVLRYAALLVTNDTGPRHIAAALGTPVITLFGPTDHRWTTLPQSVREHLITAAPFLPEDRTANDHPRDCAIDRIPLADVLFAARQVLSRN